MQAGLPLEPTAKQMPMAERADRLEAQEHEPVSIVSTQDLGEATLEDLDADPVKPSEISLAELVVVGNLPQPPGRGLSQEDALVMGMPGRLGPLRRAAPSPFCSTISRGQARCES
jgi:hypothetical protein